MANQKTSDAAILKKLAQLANQNDPINPELYAKYDVKRGLRNSNGTGVLVGLTHIGDVVGYKIEDGNKIPVPGRLIYRGYDVEDLIADSEKNNQFGFEQCIYLLLFGQLPNQKQLENFNKYLGSCRVLPENFTEDMIMKAPSDDIMNKVARGVLASYSYDDNSEDRSVGNIVRQCIELIARFSTLAAYGYQAKRRYYDGKSMFIHNPKPELSTAENFLRLIRADKKYTRLEAEILDLALILHAEHGGGNNSTFTCRVLTSSGTDAYSAYSAAIGSLKGPRHGGANKKVTQMIEDFKANIKNWDNEGQVADYVRKTIRKETNDHTGLVYGMGHAVYTLSDPRAVILKKKAFELAKGTEFEKEFNLLQTVERLTPEIFHEVKGSSKVVCANVDMYSGLVYKMLGIPQDLFTPLFAVARMAGWCAHRFEEMVTGRRIIRPAYKAVMKKKEYIPINER